MKRIIALWLVLSLLAAACAEDGVCGIRLTRLRLSAIDSGRETRAALRDVMLDIAMGRARGVPALRCRVEIGGQMADIALQVQGDRLLMAMGGVSNVYCVDLYDISGAIGRRLANGLAGVLTLAGECPDALMSLLRRLSADGARELRFDVPDALVRAASDIRSSLSGAPTGSGATGGAALAVRIDRNANRLALELLRDGRGLRMRADMAPLVETLPLIDIRSRGDALDLTRLSPQALEELRGELGIIALKCASLAGSLGLNVIIP